MLDVLNRLTQKTPLAVGALELLSFVTRPEVIEPLYERYRGKGYTGELSFPALLDMLSIALIQDGGSGHRQYVAQGRGPAPVVDSSNFYRKLQHMSPVVSQALLREPTRELQQIIPLDTTILPRCFDAMELVIIDGKKIKNVAKRLAPTRGFTGALLGAAALVGVSMRSGLALAFSYSLDGETNDVPMVPDLLSQVRESLIRTILWVADRQFCDGKTLGLMNGPAGDHFVVRIRKGLSFRPDPDHPARTTTDSKGRAIIEEVGTLFAVHSVRVRRITLKRMSMEDIVIVTDLMDAEQFGAEDLLELYRRRWGIEQVFQQITETFSLEHLIGCSPNAVLFQLSFCLMLYNVTQVVRAYLAQDGNVSAQRVSMFNLFCEIERGMTTMLLMCDQMSVRVAIDVQSMRERLKSLIQGRWHKSYLSRSDKKPRERTRKKVTGGLHKSVQKFLVQSPREAAK